MKKNIVALRCSKELFDERIKRLQTLRKLNAPDIIIWFSSRIIVHSFRVSWMTRIRFWWMEKRPNWTFQWWWTRRIEE